MDEETDNQKIQVNLLAQLREGSEYLENQKEDLSRLWEEFRGKVVTFYETKKTKSVKKVSRYHNDHVVLPQLWEPCVLFLSFLKRERGSIQG